MKCVEIEDIKKYHYYGNVKVDQNCVYYIEGFANDDNNYDYVLHGKNLYDVESPNYCVHNGVYYCKYDTEEKMTNLYHDNQLICCIAKSNILLVDFIDDHHLVVLAYEELYDSDSDYEVLDEIPFYMNGKGITNKKRNHIYIWDLEKNMLHCICDTNFSVSKVKVMNNRIYFTGQNFQSKQAVNDGLYMFDSSLHCLIEPDTLSIHDFFYLDQLYIFGSKQLRYGLNENPMFYDLDLNLVCEFDACLGNSVGSDCALVPGNSSVVYGHRYYFVSTIEDHNELFVFDGMCVSVVYTFEGTIHSFGLGDDHLYFIGADTACLQELYRDGKQISAFHDLRDTFVSVPQEVSFGDNLKGWVLLPKDYDENSKYPAILDIHGGPKTVYGTVFYHEMQVWASLGYFVFYCNIHGSDGRGNEFMDIRGKYGTIDYDDLMEFCDVVVDRYPAIDVNRMGVTGGSYGGFMTNWIIGHTNRFKCACSQRSISNWVSFSYTSDIGPYFGADQQGCELSNVDALWWHSPLKYVDSVVTPTLFIHSDEDYRCPLSEGLQMLNGLLNRGIEARMCVFHGENHELSRSGKPDHRIRRLNEITEWMELHLK